MQIKIASKKDAAALHEMDKVTFDLSFSLEYIQWILSNKKKYKIFNIIEDEKIIATAYYDNYNCYILNLAVMESFRGKGYGSILLNHILDKYPKDMITLHVREDNLNAIRFYEKWDFEIVRKLTKYYPDGSNGFIMQGPM